MMASVGLLDHRIRDAVHLDVALALPRHCSHGYPPCVLGCAPEHYPEVRSLTSRQGPAHGASAQRWWLASRPAGAPGPGHYRSRPATTLLESATMTAGGRDSTDLSRRVKVEANRMTGTDRMSSPGTRLTHWLR